MPVFVPPKEECVSRGKHFDSIELDQLTLPSSFGTTTIPAQQSVSSSILLITPKFSILWSSFFTFGRRGMGTHLGVVSANGIAPSCSLITVVFQLAKAFE